MANRIEGLPELLRKFDNISAVTKANVLRDAGKFAMKPTLRILKSKAPVGDYPGGTKIKRTVKGGSRSIHRAGTYKKNVRMRTRLSKKGQRGEEVVRIKVGVFGEAVHYAYWYEFGAPANKQPPRNLIRRVWNRTKNGVVVRMGKGMAKFVEAAARKP